MPNTFKETQQDAYMLSEQEQGSRLLSFGAPPLSIWQSAVLAYAGAKCGINFTSIEHTDRWLRTNPQNPEHLTVQAVFGLLLVEPPKDHWKFPPAQPSKAA